MTLEKSHGRVRLAIARLSDVETPASALSGPPPKVKRSKRAGLRAVRATILAAVTAELAATAGTSEASAAQAGAETARIALSLYASGRQELRSNSPIAMSHLLRWALGIALSQRLTMLAVDAGLASALGMQLIDKAHACEARAERASTAALTFARALPRSAMPAPSATPWLEPRGDK